MTISIHIGLDDAVIIRDALAQYRSPISDNMAARDTLLELMQVKIDREAAAEVLPADWLQQQYAACGLKMGA